MKKPNSNRGMNLLWEARAKFEEEETKRAKEAKRNQFCLVFPILLPLHSTLCDYVLVNIKLFYPIFF